MPALESDAALKARIVAAPDPRPQSLGVAFWVAIAWLALTIGLAALADVLPLEDPTHMSLLARRAGPSLAHLLGTDSFGRDILSRLIYGARSSLTIGLVAPLIGVSIGGLLGLLAGHFRGYLEVITVGVMDVLLAFPPLILALAVTAYLGQSVANLTAVLGLLTVPPATRIARAATLAVAQQEFVVAARALGANHRRTLTRVLLPNVLRPMAVLFLLAVAVIIVAEGALSFLGLGVPLPMPSWGGMIAEGSASLDIAPHIAFIPAATMFFTVLAFNLLGDALQARSAVRGALL